jgi:hypothetical protein
MMPRASFVLAALLASSVAHATGRGPVYGLATPTLGKGSWSLDVGVMGMDGDGQMLMLRPMVDYGNRRSRYLEATSSTCSQRAPTQTEN